MQVNIVKITEIQVILLHNQYTVTVCKYYPIQFWSLLFNIM
jgi:hypothetical protein